MESRLKKAQEVKADSDTLEQAHTMSDAAFSNVKVR